MSNYSAFFYGSLMSKTVLSRVLCGNHVSELDKTLKMSSVQFISSKLKGYTRSSLKGEDYPAMVATDNGQAVTGMLVENLSKKDIEALDVFEGDWYKRIPVQVMTTENRLVDTEAYLFIGDHTLLTGTDWDFEQFLESGREQAWLDERCDFYQVDAHHIA